MKKLLLLYIFILIAIFSYADEFHDEFLHQVNEYRVKNGLPELAYEYRFELLAKDFSDMCALKGISDHDAIRPEHWGTVADRYDINVRCYELLVFAPVEDPPVHACLDSLQCSPLHNEALLSEDGINFGVNYTNKKGVAYVTVYIGRR